MARRGRMCVVPECDRKASIGSIVCVDHREAALGEEANREIGLMTRRLTELAKLEDAEEKRAAAKLFRQQVARGDYGALFSTKMVELLNENGKGYGLRQEIGAMRIGMMRLLTEEDNPGKMAHGLAMLSFALGQALQLQEKWDVSELQMERLRQHFARLDAYTPLPRAEEPANEQKVEMVERGIEVASGRNPELEPNGFKPLEWPRPGRSVEGW